MQDPNDHPNEDQGYDAPTLPYAPYGDTIASSPTQPAGASGSAEAREPGNSLASQATSEDDTITFQTPPEQESTVISPPPGDTPGIPDLPASFESGMPPKKSRKRLWIALAIVGALLVILIPVATLQILAYMNRSTPVKTLDTFCDALIHENYGTAYSQLSSNIQTQLSESDFAGSLSLDKIVVCKHGVADEASPRASTSLELVHSSQGINRDIVFLTKDKNNYWKIDDLQKQA
jgi:hypothetical protein